MLSFICSYLSYQSLTKICYSFSLVLLSGKFSYQLPLSGPFTSLVIVSATPRVTSISHPDHLSGSSISYLHEVIVPCTCIKSLITYLCQLLLSLMSIYYLIKILVSGILSSYFSLTTIFLLLIFSLSTTIISYYCLLNTPWLLRLLRLFLSAIRISYSFLLLSATLTS